MPHATSGVKSQVWGMCISNRSTSSRNRSGCVALPDRLTGFRANINNVRLQAKQNQLEDKTKELKEHRYELEQLREEKDEDVQILQESGQYIATDGRDAIGMSWSSLLACLLP